MSVFSSLCDDIVDFGTKNSNPRKNPVTKITPHHMAGIRDAVSCAKSHLRGSASANYYIGNDGKICGGVSEDRRAWTSGTGNSKGTNDHMAITIEVSNNTDREPWTISSAAYKSLVALCADLCRRYDITPHCDKTKNGTITEHYMFQATACPGATLKNIIETGILERDILAKMGQEQSQTSSQPQPTPSHKKDEEIIWDYFSGRIKNDFGTAGLVGNLYGESRFKPNNLQDGFEKRLGMNDAAYTEAVDNGSYSKDKFIKDGAGYGLPQITFWSRKEDLYNFKGDRSIGDLYMQLDFIWWELNNGFKGVLQALQKATSIYDATKVVLEQYERPADQSESVCRTRAAYGQTYYDKYAKGIAPVQPSTDLPYVVRITVDVLNVRKGPGTQYDVVRTVSKGEAFTIIELSGNWGRLKSKVGWIDLSYTTRL